MQLQITGLHMDVGDPLREHCAEALKAVKAFFPQEIDVDVQFSKDQHKHTCEVGVHASQIHLRASGEGENMYHAIDYAVEKLKRQLDKYKGRLQKHRRRRDGQQVEQARQIEAVYQRLEEGSLENAPEEFAEFQPDVIHKTPRTLNILSVDEAVMQMDLMHTNCCLFINQQTQVLNVVFREEDGSVSWVETDRIQADAAVAS